MSASCPECCSPPAWWAIDPDSPDDWFASYRQRLMDIAVENLARFICDEVSREMPVSRVRVFETDTSVATYLRDGVL